MNGFKLSGLSAALFSFTALAAYAAPQAGASFYADGLSLSDGIDSAVMSAFVSAGRESGVMPGVEVKVNSDDAFLAVKSLRLSAGKLYVELDKDKVVKILQKNGTPVWQGLSDPIIVWLYEGDGVNGGFAGDTLSSFADSFLKSADSNKFRLMFPLLDLEDIQNVSLATLEQSDNRALSAASGRYGSAFAIAALVRHLPDGRVNVNCKLLNKDGQVIYEHTAEGGEKELADNEAQAIAAALNSVLGSTDGTFADYDAGGLGAHKEFVRLKIYGLNNLNDWTAFARELSGIGIEGNISCFAVEPDGGVIVDVYTNLSAETLDGSLEHSSEFSKEDLFSYRYNLSTGKLNPQVNSIGKASGQRPDTRVAPPAVSPVNFSTTQNGY